ncbi:MAG: 2-C-methyl-D-erythritol 4-phosphate cytidylyltransferase [Planctomycetes bacterium]|nr:2-C-methyl-D-erythritol 4-phosphate cytidylyltransferase [Planctomycetota bacterium]
MNTSTNVSLIIPAAGLSVRMKADKRKPYLKLGVKPIIFHTLEKFLPLPAVKEIILVVNKDDVSSVTEKWSDELRNYKVSKIIPGGKRRQDSVYEGLLQLNDDTEIVLVHDGVRPIVSRDTIETVINKAYEHGAAIVATQIKSTVKKCDPNFNILETVPRHNLWMAQTPQGFQRDIILNAYGRIRNTEIEFTDDAEVVEKSGCTVKIVSGSDDNIKITTREDLQMAEYLLKVH